MPNPSVDAERPATLPAIVRDPVPGLVLPSGLSAVDAVLYLPDGREHRVGGPRAPVPAELCHLDLDAAGVAVPWVSATDDRDHRRRVALVDELCAICGFGLAYRKTFLVAAGTEADVRRSRVSYAPGTHDVCAAYAVAAYPLPDNPKPGHPFGWWRYVTRKYRTRLTTTGALVAQLAAPVLVGPAA